MTTSPDNGALAWQGLVRGDPIEAICVRTRERLLWTTRRTDWFRGDRTEAMSPHEPTR